MTQCVPIRLCNVVSSIQIDKSVHSENSAFILGSENLFSGKFRIEYNLKTIHESEINFQLTNNQRIVVGILDSRMLINNTGFQLLTLLRHHLLSLQNLNYHQQK